MNKKLRILQIDKFTDVAGQDGGASRHVADLSELLLARGHEVVHFGCSSDESSELPLFRDFAQSRRPADLLRMIHNAEAAAKLRAFLERTAVDIAHLHNIYHHLTPSILPVLAGRGIAIVMTLHDYRLACPTRHFLRRDGLCTRCLANRFYHAASPSCAAVPGAALALESAVQRFARRYIRWVDLFYCPTHYMRSVLMRTGVSASKAAYLPHPVQVPAEPSSPPDDGCVLYAGRLSHEKGPLMMLDLAKRLQGAKVVIAGAGPLETQMRRQINRLGLANVELLGWVDRRGMRQLYERSAVVVVPSLCMENSPLTMLEAMAAGRCVVVPDQPPLREWIEDRRTGRTFPTGDADRLCEVVGEVLADSSCRRRMGAAAGRLVSARHRPDEVLERLEELYLQAVRRCKLRR